MQKKRYSKVSLNNIIFKSPRKKTNQPPNSDYRGGNEEWEGGGKGDKQNWGEC